jgi:hypothetical protein
MAGWKDQPVLGGHRTGDAAERATQLGLPPSSVVPDVDLGEREVLADRMPDRAERLDQDAFDGVPIGLGVRAADVDDHARGVAGAQEVDVEGVVQQPAEAPDRPQPVLQPAAGHQEVVERIVGGQAFPDVQSDAVVAGEAFGDREQPRHHADRNAGFLMLGGGGVEARFRAEAAAIESEADERGQDVERLHRAHGRLPRRPRRHRPIRTTDWRLGTTTRPLRSGITAS